MIPPDRQITLPLSAAQEGIWFAQQLGDKQTNNFIAEVVTINGPVDESKFKQAAEALVSEAESMRIRVGEEGGELYQCVSQHVHSGLEIVDLSDLACPQDVVSTWIERDLQRKVDFGEGPLHATILFRVTPSSYAWYIRCHHMACDGYGGMLLVERMAEHYNALVEERDPSPNPFATIRELVDDDLSYRSSVRFQADREFWMHEMEGYPEAISLAHHAAVKTTKIFHETASLSSAIKDKLRQVTEDARVGEPHVLFAAVAAYVCRMTGVEDVILGVHVAARTNQVSRSVPGAVANIIPLRVKVNGEATLQSVIEQVRQTTWQALRHQRYRIEPLLRDLGVVGSGRTLFRIEVNYASFKRTLRFGSAVATVTNVSTRRVEDITFEFYDRQDGRGLLLDVYFSRIAYTAAEAQAHRARFLGFMETVLQGGTGLKFGEVALLSSLERDQVVQGWNQTRHEIPWAMVHELFEAQVERTPDALAVIYEDRSVSYEELNRRANQVAHLLRERGVGPESIVGICVGRSVEMVVGLLGILKSGGAYLPLDPSYPAERLEFMVKHAQPVCVLTAGEAWQALGAGAAMLKLDDEKLQRVLRKQPEGNPDAAQVGLLPEHPAYLIYTSGSTGIPKSVVVRHEGLTNVLTWMDADLALGKEDRLLAVTTIAFDIAALEIYLPLIGGSVLVLTSQNVLREPARLVEVIRNQRATVMQATPSQWRLLIEHGGVAAALKDLTVLVGGEALPAELARKLCASVKSVRNLYGPTETTIWSVAHRFSEGPGDVVPIGRPIWNTRVYLLDGRMQPVPVGVAGELYIGGAGVARGYLNRPELTAERFIASPFVEGERLYRTGDLGRYLPDGNIEFLGRNDFQVKIRGYRIELGEIEARLASHPGVGEAVVVAREDDGGDKRLVAYYTPAAADLVDEEGNASGRVDAEELRAYLSAALPDYMVPSAYVAMDSLPLTPNGKLDRRALPAPDREAYGRRDYEPPQGEIEQTLARIWCDLLGLERVSRHDSFFEHGGHSLLAIRMIARLRNALGLELALAEVFVHPVLSVLAQKVARPAVTALPAIVPVERSGALPLSFAQQRLWFLAQMEGVREAYHISGGVRLSGHLDDEALGFALNRIVQRHEALRTRFVVMDGEPMQQIDAAGIGFALEEQDLAGEREQEEVLAALAAAEAGAAFDLEKGPLIRGRLVRLGAEEHVLLVTMHHIVSDGWSMGILLKEFSALYWARCIGQEDPLPALTIQYGDYAQWQRRWLSGEALESQAEYWSSALSGAPELLELPTDHRRPMQQSYNGGRIEVELDAELTAGLKALSLRHGTTLFMTILAGFAALLSRLSGQQDIVIGSPVANRTRSEIEGLIGFFVNTLALRLDLSGDPSVRELLERVKQKALSAQANQELPFEQVVELIRPVRNLAHAPLFQVMFAWQNNEPVDLDLPELRVSALDSEQTLAQFDLKLDLTETGDCISGRLEYARALFDRETVERYVRYLVRLLEEMVGQEGGRLSKLSMLPAAERKQLVEEWNATELEYPSHRCVHELFQEQVERTPDAIAVVFEDKELSYEELNRRANQLAHHLRELGVRPDDRVAICVERSLEMVVGLLAVLKAGGAYVPLDPTYPSERMAYMLADSEVVAVLTHKQARTAVDNALAVGAVGPSRDGNLDQLFGVPILNLVEEASFWAHQPDSNPDVHLLGLTSRHLAYVIYTSGSTGKPKGVMIEHRALVNRLVWMQDAYRLIGSDRVLQKTSFSFDVSVWEFHWPLMVGARLIVARPEGHKDSRYLSDLIRQTGVTTLHFVPSMLQVFLDHANSWQCTSLSTIICSGEALSLNLARRLRQKLTRVELHNLYGPTEAAIDVMAWACPADVSAITLIPIGRPIWNTQIYILDGQGEPVPVGVSGELYIGGAGLGRGYLNRSELTAERFIASPFEQGERLYRTGDLGRYLPDRNIEFLGRNDFQVKIRGYRIELGEIEARLTSHAGVAEAVVVAREEEGGDKRLVAYYTPAAADAEDEGGTTAGQVDAEKLRAHLSTVLPEYMVPSAYVAMDSFPLTPNGKLDRRALPAPDDDAYRRSGYEPPRGEIEETLAGIWCELLGLERVSRHDGFFELGGHSLLGIRMIARLRVAGLTIAVRDLFTHPVLSQLAGLVESDDRPLMIPANGIVVDTKVIEPWMVPLADVDEGEIARIVASVAGGVANVQDIYGLSPLQEGVLYHHLSSPDGDPHLLSVLLGMSSRVIVDGFVSALQAVIARHDILRTAVLWEGLRSPVQVVLRQALLVVEEVVPSSSDGDVATQLQRRYDPRRYRMDVREAPLLRLFIARDDGNDRWVALLLHHHLAVDHVALELVVEEVAAHLSGWQDQLPAPIAYRRHIAQVRLGVSQEEHTAFFERMLGDVEEPTLPYGLIDIQGDGREIEEAVLALGGELSRRIREAARRLSVNPASLFHLAFGQVVGRLSGREDVVFGTVLLGRHQGNEGAERSLGMFINMLPVRLKLDAAVEEAVRQTHATLIELIHHEHAPLALAQRASKVGAPLPLFSGMLNYRHSLASAGQDAAGGLLVGIKLLRAEERTNYPFSVIVDDFGRDYSLTAQVSAAADPSRVSAYMEQTLKEMVRALEEEPDAKLSRLSMVPAAERKQLMEEWNATEVEYPSHRCVHELFQEQVERSSDAIAVVFEDKELSYRELNRRANQLAHHLRELGVKPDDRVAICVERSLEMVVGLLAVLKAGGAYVPLDPTYPSERLGYMLADSEPVAVLTHKQAREALDTAFAVRAVGPGRDGELDQVPGVPILDLVEEAPLWAHHPDNDLDVHVLGLTSRHLAYVIYTSGSTGEPKGVMIEHRNVVNYLDWAATTYEVKSGGVTPVNTSFAFDATVTSLLTPLTKGGEIRLLSQGEDELASLSAMLEGEVDLGLVKMTPAHLEILRQMRAGAMGEELAGVFVIGGEALMSRQVEEWRRGSPRVRLINEYGPTEATVGMVVYEVSGETSGEGSIPIGRPIANTRIYLLDGEGEPVPVGVSGELHIGGAGVGRGYWKRPELTAERFIASPFVEGERLYRTGDLGRYLADGNIEFLGRNDFQVKIRGYRIELGEIEARLASHAGVGEAVVVVREDDGGDKRLVAYYTSVATDSASGGNADRRVGAEALRAHLSAVLPDYMVPSAYVEINSFPLTRNGKLDRQALPAPDDEAYGRRGYEPPQGETEKTLAAIWCEFLGLERVGRHDSFFELGGHSLLAVQMIVRLRETGLMIDVRDLFEAPTIVQLARKMQEFEKITI